MDSKKTQPMIKVTVVCSWCRTVVATKQWHVTDSHGNVSHTVCQSCYNKLFDAAEPSPFVVAAGTAESVTRT